LTPSRRLCELPRRRTHQMHRSRWYGSTFVQLAHGARLICAVLTSQCLDKNIGIQILEQAIEDIKVNITKAGGDCSVKMAPKAVTENDDAELAALMEKRERENQEVSGDEDESTSDEGGVAEAD
jgi:hypothetical protein